MHKLRYKRSFKNDFFGLFLIIVFCIGIGYALLSKTLSINGNSEVKQNTWDIHFENIKIKDGSVGTESPPTLEENNPSLGFSITLDLPGDFYEFTVDVVNAGTIDAMLESVTKTPDLSEAQQKYLKYIIEYQNGEQLAAKQLVSKDNGFVRLKVRVEYRKDLNAEDLPTTAETIYLAFSVNYVQADNTGIVVTNNGVKVESTANGSLDDIGTIVTIGDQQFYTIGTEGDNVKLLSMYNLYVGNSVDANWNVTPLSNPTGMQDSTARGWESDVFPIITTAYSSDAQKGTNYSDYSGSIVEGYVNNYKTLLESKFGVEIEEARLITKDELTNSNTFACIINVAFDYGSCVDSPYKWIYSTSYWTSTVYDTYSVWFVDTNGNFYNDDMYCWEDNTFGVRPVIILKKSDIVVEKKIIEFTIDDSTYQAEEGMTWGEWVDSEYNNESYTISNNNNLVFTSPEGTTIKNGNYFISKDDVIDPNIQYLIHDNGYYGQ